MRPRKPLRRHTLREPAIIFHNISYANFPGHGRAGRVAPAAAESGARPLPSPVRDGA